MGIRRAKCYREIKRAYTRKSKYKKKGFIKAVPPLLVAKFDMGDVKKQYKCRVDLVSLDSVQLRHNAIESARLMVFRRLSESLGNNFHFQIRAYPHHVLRENKMLTGAGADRMQTGMQLAFGKAIGLAAQVKKNKPIMSVYLDPSNIEVVKVALKSAMYKLPCKCVIVKEEL